MGIPVIGRPSCTGGVYLLGDMLVDLPTTVQIIVVGERDQNDNGQWPGRDGALSTAEFLSSRLGRPVEALFPPDGAKDTRAWFTTQRCALDDRMALTALGKRFLAGLMAVDVKIGSPCGLVADTCSCPDSRVLENGTVRNNQDSATNPQPNRNQSANCSWKLPKRIREKYASNAWDCPCVRGVAGLANLSPALIAATCRKRSCPVCRLYWCLQTYDRFGCHLSGHDGQLYVDTVPDFDWQAIHKDMSRRARKLGVPLRYVSMRCKEGDELTVIASVPIRPDVAHPVELSAALHVLERAIDDTDWGPRPFSACRAWGPLEHEKEAERVPGGCSPAAFKATVKAWGADVSAKAEQKRIIKPDRANMFRSESGELDAMAQADFWREAETRDFAGDAAARETHERLTQVRKQRKPALQPCKLCSPADRIIEIAPDGRRRQVCGKCGDFFGYLPSEARLCPKTSNRRRIIGIVG